MTIARAIRMLLAFASILIVVWSFFDVTRRAIVRHNSQQDRPIVINILHWGNPAESQIVQNLIDEYMRANPHVRINRIQANDFRPKLKTMMAAGTPPDLFYLPPDALPELAQLKLIRPIDEYLEKDRQAGQLVWLDDFYPVVLDAFRYDTKTQRIGAGALYGLPKDFTTQIFYVNVDLFEKAGVPIPYKGWTWDEFEADMKKIRALNGTPGFEGRAIYGGYLQLWPDTLRDIIWTYGGDFFATRSDGSADFRDVTLDDPPAQEALQMIRRVRLEDQTVFNATGIAKEGGQEFQNGNIGCTGPIGRWMTATYKEAEKVKFRFDVVPVPYKTQPASQIFTTAWTISTKAENPDECYKLMKYLSGPEGQKLNSRLGLAIPSLKSVATSKRDFLEPDELPKHNSQAYLDAIEFARLGQIPREAEWNRIVDDNITNSIQLGTQSTIDNAKEIERKWLAELDSPLRRRAWPEMNWSWVLGAVGAGIAVLLAALIWKARREKLGPLDRAQERAGFAFVLPWLIGFLALTLGPMITSLLLSFTKWTAMTPITSAESVGVANFKQLFFADPTFYQSLKVTAYYLVLAVPVTQGAALAVAILMNVKVRGITIFRTVYFVPSVVSGAALAVLWLQIFNKDYGILNAALRPILGLVHLTPPDWFGLDAQVWAIPAFVIMGLWGVGGGMILYLAGLKGIPVSLYEAATIDGAGVMRKFWNVTLPMLSPLIFYNLVMGIIGSFQVFTQAYIMTGAGPNNATLFYVLSLYRHAFEFHNMGYASAMAWVLFIVILLVTLLVFRGSKNLVYYEGLKT